MNVATACAADPDSAIIAKAGATAGMEAELRRLQSILKNDPDNLIVQFEEDRLDFVSGYFDSRKTTDLGGGKANPAISTPLPTP